jgi:hypothetical protein
MQYRPLMCGWLVLCVSCTSLHAPINQQPYSVECPAVMASTLEKPLPMAAFDQDEYLLARYSLSSLVVANAFGLMADLRALEELRSSAQADRPAVDTHLDWLLMEHEISQRLDLVAHELENLERFIDCQTLELAKVSVHLVEVNARAQNKMTNAAILVGALSTVAVAGILVSENKSLQDGDAKDWIGVAGGAVAAYLAIRSQRLNRTVSLQYEQNVISAIWRSDNSLALFPPSSWYLLNAEALGDKTTLSIREQIVASWTGSPIMLGDEDNLASLAVLLDAAGTYDEKMLQLRIDMMEEIEAGVHRLKNWLVGLKRELSRNHLPTTTP